MLTAPVSDRFQPASARTAMVAGAHCFSSKHQVGGRRQHGVLWHLPDLQVHCGISFCELESFLCVW